VVSDIPHAAVAAEGGSRVDGLVTGRADDTHKAGREHSPAAPGRGTPVRVRAGRSSGLPPEARAGLMRAWLDILRERTGVEWIEAQR
jgi:hypothetical protein